MPNKDQTLLIKKLIYKSKYMGCRENDIIFSHFAINNLAQMQGKKLFLYADLLQQNDADLFAWVTQQSSPKPEYADLIAQIINHIKSTKNG